jgi:hypothetical protein
MHHFCTYFDRNYLTRGLALHESLLRHCGRFQLWILAMDPESEALVGRLKLPSVRLVSLAELEAAVPGLTAAKANRSRLEFYFTCTPALPGHVLASDSSVDRITYLDADLWFFADPSPIFDEIGDAPIAVIEHRFSPANAHLEQGSGRFNVSWVAFRRDPEAAACLARWRAQCLEWCHDRPDKERNADQKYLDEWPALYPGLRIISAPGAGIAPWNVATAGLSAAADKVTVRGGPLLFFHFHGLTQVGRRVYDPVLAHFSTAATPALRKHVYEPYVRTLEAIRGLLSKEPVALETLGHIRGPRRRPAGESDLLGQLRTLRRILTGEYLFISRIGGNAATLAKDLALRLGLN